ncbi:hypothetical protein FB451DRAFT_1477516 [Mycena latifolia]|nr:hypothetical protein FB451DRAFT_1477516 [Mycena latifolia]
MSGPWPSRCFHSDSVPQHLPVPCPHSLGCAIELYVAVTRRFSAECSAAGPHSTSPYASSHLGSLNALAVNVYAYLCPPWRGAGLSRTHSVVYTTVFPRCLRSYIIQYIRASPFIIQLENNRNSMGITVKGGNGGNRRRHPGNSNVPHFVAHPHASFCIPGIGFSRDQVVIRRSYAGWIINEAERLALEVFTNALLRRQLASPPQRDARNGGASGSTTEAIDAEASSTRQSTFATRKPQAHQVFRAIEDHDLGLLAETTEYDFPLLLRPLSAGTNRTALNHAIDCGPSHSGLLLARCARDTAAPPCDFFLLLISRALSHADEPRCELRPRDGARADTTLAASFLQVYVMSKGHAWLASTVAELVIFKPREDLPAIFMGVIENKDRYIWRRCMEQGPPEGTRKIFSLKRRQFAMWTVFPSVPGNSSAMWRKMADCAVWEKDEDAKARDFGSFFSSTNPTR